MSISTGPVLWAITGAAGKVGRHLRTALGPQLGNILLLDITDPGPLLPNEKSITVDLRDFDGVRAALEGVTGVIHLGGVADEADFADLVSANILGTHHVLEAARQQQKRCAGCTRTNLAWKLLACALAVSRIHPARPASSALGSASKTVPEHSLRHSVETTDSPPTTPCPAMPEVGGIWKRAPGLASTPMTTRKSLRQKSRESPQGP